MTKLIIIVVLTIGIMLFLGTYEGFNLLYFEENVADRYATYGGLPFLLYFLVALFLDKYRSSLKDNRVIDATKYSLGGVAGLAIGYYFLMIPVFSGAIIWTNDLIGDNDKLIVTGQVIDKTEIDDALSEHEITVRTSEKTITFDTNKLETDKYKIGDSFTQEMKKRFWGLLTMKK